jgi:hypothetical protein
MSIMVLKDLMIEKGLLNKYYEGVVPKDLWRALKKKSNLQIFDFVEEPFKLSNGRPRPRDITIKVKNGERWVFVKDKPRGVSTFDKEGVPPGKGWEYYLIPAGTKLPEGLAIIEDHYNKDFGATHYTIAPAFDMPISQFKSNLMALAAELIKESANGNF